MISIPLKVDAVAGVIAYDYPEWMTLNMKKNIINLTSTDIGEVAVNVFYLTEDEEEISILSDKTGVIEKTEEFFNTWKEIRQAELDLKASLLEEEIVEE